jgi:WD40 repeat protein
MPVRPFPGLRPFGFEDREFFFGREDQIYSLYRLLEHSRFIAVVGSSGSGKSSLVRAGLLPVIDEESQGEGGRKWRFATLHPGDAPLRALAGAVTSLAQDSADAEIRFDRTLFALRRSSFGLTKALDGIGDLAGKSVMLVVDQFEELFRYAATSGRDRASDALWRDEAANFVQLLLEATRSRSSSIYVLITMRSDFIGDCSQFHGLPEAVSAAQFLVPSLTRDQREDVIRKPVDKAGATIDPTLVEMLLNEAGSEMDQLPVLQHCLARLWDRAEPADPSELTRHLGLAEYRAIGTISGALSQHADEVMASLPGLELAVEQVFRALSEIDKEGRATRRALPYARLLAETGIGKDDFTRVLDRFRADDCSFILPPLSAVPQLDEDTRVDVVHEALLRRWERISAEQPHVLEGKMQTGWLAAEAADGRFYRALLALLEAGSPSGVVTLPLDQVESRWRWWNSRPRTEAWADRYGGRLRAVQKLFQDSLAAAEAERIRKEEAERREREQERRKIEAEEAAKRERLEHQAEVDRMRVDAAQRLTHRTRLAAIAMSLIALLAIGLAVVAWQQKKVETQIARDEKSAEQAEAAALREMQRQKAAAVAARNALVVTYKHLAIAKTQATLEATRATRESAKAKQQTAVAVAQGIVANQQRAQALNERSQVFLQVGRQALLNGDNDDAAVLLAAAYGGDPKNPVLQLMLRQALEKLAIRAGSIQAHDDLITALAFNPKNPNQIATASTDGTAKLWTASGHLIHQFNDQGDLITAIAFDPTGKYLVTVGRDGSAKLHDVRAAVRGVDPPLVTLHDPKTGLEGHAGRINSVAYSLDGTRVLTSGSDGRVKIWNSPSGTLVSDWAGAAPGVAVNQALFTPDGRFVVACAADGSLAVWSSGGQLVGSASVSSKSPLVRLAVSPDGKTIAAGALDGTVLLYAMATNHAIERHDQQSAVNALAFDPTGSRLVSASQDGTALIADASSGEPERTLPAKNGAPAALTALFNPSGYGIETTYADGSVNLWTQEGDPIAVLPANAGAATAAAFSSNGGLLATGGDDGKVYFWHSTSPLERAAYSHRGAIESIEVDRNTGLFLTASRDGTGALWRVAGVPQLVRILPHAPAQTWVVGAHFSADGKRILTVGGQAVKVWATDSRISPPLATIVTTAPGKRFTQAAFVGRSNDVIASQTYSFAELYKLEMGTAPVDFSLLRKTNGWFLWSSDGTKVLARQPQSQTAIRELFVSKNGRTVLTLSADGQAAFCAASGTSSCATWSSAAEAVTFGDMFALGGFTGNIHLVNARGDQVSRPWPTDDGRVLTMVTSDDGKWLASGGIGGTPGAIWDLTAPGQPLQLGGGGGAIESASFSPGNATLLLAISSDGTVKLWDRESGNLVASISIPASRATAAAFTSDGSAVVVGAQSGAVYLWSIRGDVPPPAEAARLVLRESDLSGVSNPLVNQALSVLQSEAGHGG